ncbi:hypothetical protein ABK040_001424 [Willaertia magna]
MPQVRTPSYQYENINEINELLKCSICSNPLEEPVMHINTFSNECFEGKSTCPSCNDTKIKEKEQLLELNYKVSDLENEQKLIIEQKTIELENKFNEMCQNLENKYNELFNELKKEREEFEIHKNGLLNYFTKNKSCNNKDIVKFNIGGQPFCFLKETICSKIKNPNYETDESIKDEYYEPTLLETLISSNIPVTLIDNDYIFIDRDPILFHYIANYLRNHDKKIIDLPKEEEDLLRLKNEADYFLVTGLIELIEKKLLLSKNFLDSNNIDDKKYWKILSKWIGEVNHHHHKKPSYNKTMRQVRTPSYQYENLNEIDELLKCPICTNPLEEPVMHINCGYTFCNKCIEGKSTCPSCNDSNLTVCKAPRNIIVQLDNLKVTCPQCKTGVKRGEYQQHLQESCPLGKACQDLQNKEQLLELNYKQKVLDLENEQKLIIEQKTIELENKYNELFNELKKEREEFEMNRNCFVKLENSVKPIQLNVGGQLMTVGLGLFLNNHIEKGSVLKEMFTGQYPLFKTTTTGESSTNLDNNVYFIDCNPDLFKIMLDWLRYGGLAKQIIENYGEQLIFVAKYFKLNNLLNYLNDNLNKENEVKNESDLVKFNIGGKPFYFLKETICFRMKNPLYGIYDDNEYYESTLLESLISGNIPVTLIDKDYIYIDRDPTYFHYIASYLRNAGNYKDVELPKDEEIKQKLLIEAKYFGVQCLVDLIEGNIVKRIINKKFDFRSHQRYQKLLNEWIGVNENQKWQLIYRGSRDGFKAQDFHKLCDGKSHTITIIKSTSGHIFGGFTTTAWNQNYQYYSSPNSFLFSLYNPTKQDSKPMRFDLKDENNSSAIYCNSNYGPTFGGADLCIRDNCNSNNNSSSNLGNTYGINVSYKDLTGTYNFTVQEIEVFTKI